MGKLYLGTTPYMAVRSVIVGTSGTASTDPSSSSTSISFTGLQGQPTSFMIFGYPDSTTAINTNNNTVNYVLGLYWDGTTYTSSYGKYRNLYGVTGQVSATYSNGTLTVSTSSYSYGNFKNGINYTLVYNY